MVLDSKAATRQGLLRLLFRFDVAAFLACVCFFLIWPRFDLYVSQYFFDNGQGFIWEHHIIAKSIYKLTHFIGATMLIGLPILIAACWIVKNDYLIKRRNIFIFLLSACILGPGLMVNLVLKDNWGRPRPRQIIEFQGDRQYEPPFSPSFECQRCHSFVSGHASVGFFFFSVALLVGKRRWLLLPVIAGTVIGIGRMVQGGHFFSDVLFSGWVVWFCSIILYKVFVEFSLLQKEGLREQ